MIKQRCKKLSRAQKKLVWSGPTSNAGAGWLSHVISRPIDGSKYDSMGSLSERSPLPPIKPKLKGTTKHGR